MSLVPAKSGAAHSPKPEVFVVEDDVSVREALEGLLTFSGYQVRAFGSAREFLDSPRAGVPNCLILDIGLPDLNGLDLQKLVAGDRADMPVIVITGRHDLPSTMLAMKAGALVFLTKPFDDEVLLDAIHQAIERSRSARDRNAEV